MQKTKKGKIAALFVNGVNNNIIKPIETHLEQYKKPKQNIQDWTERSSSPTYRLKNKDIPASKNKKHEEDLPQKNHIIYASQNSKNIVQNKQICAQNYDAYGYDGLQQKLVSNNCNFLPLNHKFNAAVDYYSDKYPNDYELRRGGYRRYDNV